MVYFTVYLKNLNNGTGYVDTALVDDQLMRDYLQFLDIGVKAHRAYAVVDPGANDTPVGIFAVNLADVAAITVTVPRQDTQPELFSAPSPTEAKSSGPTDLAGSGVEPGQADK
ncbi:MAG: hypothetical protein RLZZ265_413 [Verrucomicrobiota bacterium]|jgi:hypothetical protein